MQPSDDPVRGKQAQNNGKGEMSEVFKACTESVGGVLSEFITYVPGGDIRKSISRTKKSF